MKKIVFLICCLVISSCGKIECDPFPRVSFFLYDKDKRYIFSNGNDELGFVVSDIWKTKKSEYKRNCDCECDFPSAKVQLENTKNTLISGYCELNETKNAFYLEYIIQQSNSESNIFSFYINKQDCVDTLIINKTNPTYTWMKFSTEKGFYGFGNDTVQYLLK